MKYAFKDILTAEIYENTRVMFILGQYMWFNNMICDTLKSMCINEDTQGITSIVVGDEFGIDEEREDTILNSVDFNTFLEVIGVASINGKWYCRIDFSTLNSKQKEALVKYIKEPSDNGILVVISTDWKQYKEVLKNKILLISKFSHVMQLGFPNKSILKDIVAQSFNERGVDITSSAVDFFVLRMSSAYDKYEEQINQIVDEHGQEKLELKEIKEYMKGIENFILDDFLEELLKPMASAKTNNKKVLRIMMALEEEFGPHSLVTQLLSKINEYIDLRILINSGYIPIGINYFYADIIKNLPESSKTKYEKTNEWVFRRKAEVASRTSLKDWEYMKLILFNAVENPRISEKEMRMKCEKTLYELCTRSVLTANRINNIIGVENILEKEMIDINKIEYDEEALSRIQEGIRLSQEDECE